MTESSDVVERLTGIEKMVAWLEQRVWTGTGNLHDRVHVLEDKNGDRVHEITKLQGDMAKVERVLGLNGYGDKNIINDLRDALDTIQKLKEGIISVKDFQTLMNDVDTLKKRGQAQLTLTNFVQLGVIGAIINFVMDFLAGRIIP
jgi:phosphoglycerate-specific signal transduction histidine kinase